MQVEPWCETPEGLVSLGVIYGVYNSKIVYIYTYMHINIYIYIYFVYSYFNNEYIYVCVFVIDIFIYNNVWLEPQNLGGLVQMMFHFKEDQRDILKANCDLILVAGG